jgi:RNA polymerase sigma factor (sigma-70 family)
VIRLDPDQVRAAREGNRAALDAILRTAERPVYNLAIRMLAHPPDAEDATQEILIKIVTHLGTLEEVEAAGAWALRIACRHLVRERKRSRVEAMRLTFEGFAADLDKGQTPLTESGLSEAEAALAVEEVKIGGTLAMLVCLTRDLRIAYLLGHVFEFTDTEAAPVLEISPAAFRQRLKRARAAVTGFTRANCGIASSAGTCSCDRRVNAALHQRRIIRGTSQYMHEGRNPADLAQLRRRVRRFEQGRAAATLMRSNPDFETNIKDLVMLLIDQGATRA